VPAGNVAPYMPVPLTECQSRNIATKPATNDVVTCTPLTP
jgi:hypothetical protein